MESISTYPGNNQLPSWRSVEAILRRIMLQQMRLKVGEELSPIFGGDNPPSFDLDKTLSIGVHFGIDCILNPQFTVSLMREKSEGRGYLIDEINEYVREDSEQEVLHLKDIESFWHIIEHHEYYVYISSPARRVKGENKLMLFLAIAFAGATNGYVHATEPDFFGIPYGMYDFDTILKVIL